MQTFIVDAFTAAPFKGNPAGVCLPDRELADDHMLAIAREINASETAFVRPLPEGGFSIRYFSPRMEIPLCGHATLAAAKVLGQLGRVSDIVLFRTRTRGELTVRLHATGLDMTLPAYALQPATAPEALFAALGVGTPLHTAFEPHTRMLLMEVADAAVLRGLRPDAARLLASHQGINGVAVTARSTTTGVDYEVRYFWPWSGTLEDPVTGAVQTFLAPYWAARLGKQRMRVHQCSERGGELEVEVATPGSVVVRGQAVIVLEGRLMP